MMQKDEVKGLISVKETITERYEVQVKSMLRKIKEREARQHVDPAPCVLAGFAANAQKLRRQKAAGDVAGHLQQAARRNGKGDSPRRKIGPDSRIHRADDGFWLAA